MVCAGLSRLGTVPSGWPECASVDECECADFSLDECEANTGNLLSGRPATENADGTTCIDWSIDPQPAGCTSENSSEAVVSFAQAPDGVCWFFSIWNCSFQMPECPYVDECEYFMTKLPWFLSLFFAFSHCGL